VYRQDPIQLYHRSQRKGCAGRPCAWRPRGPPVRGRRICRRDLRRDHDDAWSAPGARCQQHRSDRGRPNYRAVLIFMDLEQVKRWRRDERERLIALRQDLPAPDRRRWSMRIDTQLRQEIAGQPGILGVYWPFRAEFDPRPVIDWAIGDGRTIALPVVVDKK